MIKFITEDNSGIYKQAEDAGKKANEELTSGISKGVKKASNAVEAKLGSGVESAIDAGKSLERKAGGFTFSLLGQNKATEDAKQAADLGTRMGKVAGKKSVKALAAKEEAGKDFLQIPKKPIKASLLDKTDKEIMASKARQTKAEVQDELSKSAVRQKDAESGIVDFKTKAINKGKSLLKSVEDMPTNHKLAAAVAAGALAVGGNMLYNNKKKKAYA